MDISADKTLTIDNHNVKLPLSGEILIQNFINNRKAKINHRVIK